MNAKYHILIIEDHRELARLLRTGIAALGEEFVAWDMPSGEEALLELYRRQIDIAIIDLRLPGIDGKETARRLRKRQPDAKIFLISGQPEEDIRQAAEEIDADAWFRKPLELADLLDAIERKLGLVESILGETPVHLTAAEEEQAVGRMSDILTNLRENLSAQSVALLNEVGKVVLQAGSVDALIGQDSRPTLMSLYSAGLKVARELHFSQPSAHFYLSGEDIALYLTAMTPQYALLVICNRHCRSRSKDEIAHHIQQAIHGSLQVMHRLGILETEGNAAARPASPPASQQSETLLASNDPSPESDTLLALLEQSLPSEEADAFWEQLTEEKSLEHTLHPDAITYEQAQRLGLTPFSGGED